MNFKSLLRRPLLLALPALLAFSACGDDDDEPVPVQGRVTFINAASHVAPANLSFRLDNNNVASADYGRNSGYQAVNVGDRALQVASGTQTALTQTITVAMNQSYTFVATPAAATSTVGGLFVPDDLTAPSTGKAKIRVINVGQSLMTPIRLAQLTAVGGTGVIVNDVATNSASPFVEFIPGPNYSLNITDTNNTTLQALGDGSGSGTGTRTFEVGKIYTVVVSGTVGSLNANQQLKAFLFQNN